MSSTQIELFSTSIKPAGFDTNLYMNLLVAWSCQLQEEKTVSVLKTLVTRSTRSSKKKQELHAFENRRDDSELNIVLARITTAFLVYVSSNLQIHAAPAPIELIKPQNQLQTEDQLIELLLRSQTTKDGTRQPDQVYIPQLVVLMILTCKFDRPCAEQQTSCSEAQNAEPRSNSHRCEKLERPRITTKLVRRRRTQG